MRTALAIALVVTLWAARASSQQQNVNLTNFRVTSGFSDRSPSIVRLTFIQNELDPVDPDFDRSFSYNSKFRYRWVSNRVSTGLFNVTPGVPSSVVLPGVAPFNITVPAPGQGVRGIMAADICYSSPIAKCQEGEHDEILSHLPALLNGIMARGDVSFWSLIGDAFYDPTGAVSSHFWNQLHTDVKSKLFYAVPGNYDFWKTGVPENINKAIDQFGNGFMQYFGMDALSSAADSRQPWNFDNNPDDDGPSSASATSSSGSGSFVPGRQYLADASNFEFVTQVGNLGLIGYSGAHALNDTAPFLTYACQWLSSRRSTIDWIILLGHWATPDKGASQTTYTAGVYELLVTLPGCDEPGMVKYFAGHHHCNEVDQENTGFIVGGFGKSDKHCNVFGIPLIDSTGGRLLVAYFPISEKEVPASGSSGSTSSSNGASALKVRGATERYTALMACIAQMPLADCIQQVDVNIWMNVSVAEREATARRGDKAGRVHNIRS